MDIFQTQTLIKPGPMAFTNFSFTARSVYRHRANMFPPLPSDQTFAIPKQFSQTSRSESIIVYDGHKKKYDGRLLLFSTDELLQQLCKTEVILVDGTFASAHVGFEQVVVIMGMINDEGMQMKGSKLI